MQKVETVNIIFGKDPELFLQWFEEYKYFSDLVPKLNTQKEKFKIFSNAQNSFLLKFDYSFWDAAFELNLDVLDPYSEFEKWFVQPNYDLVQLITSLYGKNERFDVTRKITKKENFPNFTSYLNGFDSLQIKEYLRQENFKFVVMFGVGDDLSDWSDPFVIELVGSEIKFSTSLARVISLKFVTRDSLATNRYLPFPGKGKGFDYLVRGTGPELDFGIDAFGSFAPTFNTYDVHKGIVGALKSYISQITNTDIENVIILLPSLNYVFSDYKADEIFNVDSGIYSILRSFKDFCGKLGVDVKTVNNGLKTDVATYLRSEDLEESPKVFCSIQARTDKLWSDTIRYRYYFTTAFPWLFDPLLRFEDGLNRLVSKNVSCDFRFYMENNAKVLDLWKKEKLIKKDATQAVVYGEKRIINKILFGKILSKVEKSNWKDEEEAIWLIQKLHMDDSWKYAQESYIKQIFNLKYQQPISSKFKMRTEDLNYFYETVGEFTDLNKESTYDNFYECQKSMPVFRMTRDCPNILDLELDVSKTYLQTLLCHQVWRLDLASYVALKDNYLNAAIDGYNELFRKASESELRNNEILKSLMESVIDQNKFSFTILNEVKAEEAKTGVTHFNELLRNLYRLITDVKVKTLPLFKFSSPNDFLLQTCFLIGQSPDIAGVYNYDRIKSIFSGFYSFLGFRHVISPTEVFSEFNLVKTIPQGLVGKVKIEEVS